MGPLPPSLGWGTALGQLASLGRRISLGWGTALGRFSLGLPSPLGYLPSLELVSPYGSPLDDVRTILHDPGDVFTGAGYA
ncbi:MAG TPA: hypothetical protein GX735_01375 [Firmicutes bacterium]|nr:hypothetical protein [Bacillota bacterium]